MDSRERCIRDLVPGQRVQMYGTVIEVTAPWHEEDGMSPGWGRLPMIWAGVRCAPAELGDGIVMLAERRADAGLQRAARAGDAPGADGGGGDGLRLRGDGDRDDRADDPARTAAGAPVRAPAAPPGSAAALPGEPAPLPRRIRGAGAEYVIYDEASRFPGLPGGVIRVVPDEMAALTRDPGLLARVAAILRHGRKS